TPCFSKVNTRNARDRPPLRHEVGERDQGRGARVPFQSSRRRADSSLPISLTPWLQQGELNHRPRSLPSPPRSGGEGSSERWPAPPLTTAAMCRFVFADFTNTLASAR